MFIFSNPAHIEAGFVNVYDGERGAEYGCVFNDRMSCEMSAVPGVRYRLRIIPHAQSASLPQSEWVDLFKRGVVT